VRERCPELEGLVVQWYGRATVHSAAGAGHVAVAELLVERGADKAAGDSGGETAAELAASRGHVELAALLQP